MKLLLVGQDDSLPGGMPVYIRSLRDYLSDQTEIDFRYLNETAAKGRVDMERPNGARLLTQALKLKRALSSEIRDFKPHVAHIHVAHGLSVVEKAHLANVCRSYRVPAVLHMHGAGLIEGVATMPGPLRNYIAKAFGAPHHVVALSPSIGADLQKSFAAWKISVIPNAVDIPATTAPLPADFTIGFLGFMDGRKGEQDLVEALANSPSGIKAIFAGDGPNLETIRARSVELKLDQRVTFWGRVAGASKDRFLQSISALCLPSYAENYPIALLEAMAYGRTVIASAVGGVPDLVDPKDNGWLFQAGDVAGLSEALKKAYDNPQEVATKSEAAFQTITTKHVWAVTGPTLTKLYEETCYAAVC